MRIADLLHSVRALIADRARALLTLLGIVIGAGSIVLLAGLLRSGEEALISANQGVTDSELLQVRQDEVPVQLEQKTRRELSRADADAIGESQAVGEVTTGSETQRVTRAVLDGRKKRVTVVSGNPGSLALYRLEMGKGRFLSDDDLAERRRICVVGDEIWMELLQGKEDISDIHLMIDNEMWTVVGILKHKPLMGATTSTNIWARKVIVPETTFDAIFSPSHSASRLFIRRNPAAGIVVPMDVLRKVMDSTLLRRHFGVHNFKIDEERNKRQEVLIFDVVKLLLFSTGLIALFVGGINIMNVMLVTVTERTREIGIRRAVGATPGTILVQFLFESGTVALLGGLIGVISGVGLSWLAALAMGKLFSSWSFHVEAWSIALGLGLSVVTGVVFGIYPAFRAARLDPIEALRTE